MIVKRVCGYIVSTDMPNPLAKGLLDFYSPPTRESSRYKNWIAILDLKTCLECRFHHGQIYQMDEMPDIEPPLHPNCRCQIKPMDAVQAGYGTEDGQNGADYIVKLTGALPSNYITKQHAKNLGWINFLGNLNDVAPGMIIGGDIYKNRNGHLPQAKGRVWFEADINYDFGYRNQHRLIYSNDGLIFATYNHFMTFVEIQ